MSPKTSITLPDIKQNDTFRQVVRKLSLYFAEAIELPSTFEQLRTTSAGNSLRILVQHLAETCTNPATVNALLALKWHYASDDDQRQGVGEARSNACEIVAWRFLSCFTDFEAIQYCLYEIPDADDHRPSSRDPHPDQEAQETSPLLSTNVHSYTTTKSTSRPVGSSRKRIQLLSSLSRLTNYIDDDYNDNDNDNNETSHEPHHDDSDLADPTRAYQGLNALEIAAVADAKRFLSQPLVQRVITGIWNGHIVYWDALTTTSTKRPHFYDPRTADPFSRLRVPKYIKSYEVLFFGVFLCLYYALLTRGKTENVTGAEVAMFLWFAAFLYDEVGEWNDAGSIFYTTDIWNFFDFLVALIGVAFIVLRTLGLAWGDSNLSGWAFDVLSLEALFMIPRICSILSLSPYWGTLIPCLKEMGKDFIKFMVLVVIIYLGFLTTFSLIGRKLFNIQNMAMILTKIFFGSSSLGFDIMDDIDPIFGPPLMVIFIIFTNFLLLGSLTGMLSNSFMRVTNRAREEYLYVYSVYVLEASTSNKLTHFYPPFNLLALVIFRPWSLFFPKSQVIRNGRILLLKSTHLPVVAAIKLYEFIKRDTFEQQFADFKGSGDSERDNTSRGAMATGVVPIIRSLSPSHQHLSVPRKSVGRRLSVGGVSVEGEEEQDDGGVEKQIAELSKKIDVLTQLMERLQKSK